jgi:hypothetical protein
VFDQLGRDSRYICTDARSGVAQLVSDIFLVVAILNAVEAQREPVNLSALQGTRPVSWNTPPQLSAFC